MKIIDKIYEEDELYGESLMAYLLDEKQLRS